MLSVSDLSEFTYCPRALYLKKDNLHTNGSGQKSELLLNIRREIFDSINNSQESIISSLMYPDKNLIEKALRENYSHIVLSVLQSKKGDLNLVNRKVIDVYNHIWPDILNKLNEQTSLLFNFMLRTGFKGTALWINLEPKIEFERYVESQNLKMRGVITQLLLFKNKVVPLGFKTGKAPKSGVWLSHKLEMAAYIMLINDIFNMKNRRAVVKYKKDDVERQVVLNPMLEYEVKRKIKLIRMMLSEEEPPKRCSNTNKCRHCNMRNVCYALAK